ncbi:uncharacterized protein LOC114402121 [Glycine soja]|uniref:uncharacterized protein LOC114402121 n=1 Tax=Glycine soja TaxID=3848 RepID=UPI0010391C6B|nr:uncharacterized protein LOC114402121 [Glycine soja]
MADNRSKTSSDRLEDAIAKLTTHQLSLSETLQTMTHKLDTLITTLSTSKSPDSSPTFSPHNPPPSPSASQPPRVKLDVPRFDGTDPLGWIFKITQFFEYHHTPEQERLTIASFYMDGRALAWYQWMAGNGQLSTWASFLHALQTRFASSQYDDPTGTLFKLTQRTTVAAYLSEFEDTANRVVGLPPHFLLSCFVSGLNPDIRREVQALQPLTLVQAAGLARLQEEKLAKNRRSFRNRPPSFSMIPQNPISVPPSPCTVSAQSLSPVPLKRLTPDELASRRERGLCFKCDERYHRGHRCQARVNLLIMDEEERSPEEAAPLGLSPEPPDLIDPNEAQLNLHSLTGPLAPETLRFSGFVASKQVLILVDGGSTHNFIQDAMLPELGLFPSDTTPLKVMVGNGQYLHCNQICTAVSIVIQGIHFIIDLHVLPLCGANVVLGVQWLRSLGPILTDYTTLSMKFMHEGRTIELQGDDTSALQPLSVPQARRLVRTSDPSACFLLSVTSHESPSNTPTYPPDIQFLLTKFAALFQPSQTLPPSRPTDHHIHLVPNSEPVNVRPYRYPHYQKAEIEAQVSSMLRTGIIRPSTSPFSSLVLLVRKHDGTWGFCVDYRALNALTIKDHFLIPTIDELLDDLGGAAWFSKLDLLQGYHQILMSEGDISKTAFRTHHGHFEFTVMPFGLCNASSSFQATMNTIFRPFLRQFIIVFFDDILIYSATLEDHVSHLEQAFQVLLQEQFVLKFSKCTFAQPQVEYLGHVVSSQGVAPVLAKVQAIQQWLKPRSARALRSFLGLTGFYRRFIRGYASIAAPLTKLLTLEIFHWTSDAVAAFTTLKQMLTSFPVLRLPDFNLPFTVETDALGTGMGAVLSQQGHPVAYFSKMFPPKLLQASTYVRELFAITAAVKRWRQYLLGRSFTILTDHRSLKELLTQVIQTPEQQKYLARLMGYDYNIQYRFGSSNVVADALSRVSEPTPELFLLLSVPCFTFLQELKAQLEQCPTYTQLR